MVGAPAKVIDGERERESVCVCVCEWARIK